VQIVETTALGVRVIVLTLKRRESPMRFLLFPMIHVGLPEFYESVRAQVEKCDVVVLEGIRGRSMPVSWLTMSYRITRFSRRSKLIVQNLRAKSFDIPVIRPDMTNAQFRGGWRRVPWLDRVLISCMVPFMATNARRAQHRRAAA
jgi:hypothetical protein